MDKPQFFHLCGDGANSRNFITSLEDFKAAFNLVGVCAANTDVIVVSFSHEESHGHCLLWGTEANCLVFKDMFGTQYRHYTSRTRKRGEELILENELYPIQSEEYLLNVAAYTVIQATKDGKPVMYYDYRWGTGSLYFRSETHVPVWLFDDNGQIQSPVRFDSLGRTEQRDIVHSRALTIPDDWLICNGLILPSNYVDIKRYEGIYRTHNRFRVFTASPKSKEEELRRIMSTYHGVTIDDLEARSLCGDLCKTMFGTRDPRRLNTTQRVNLAQQLRRQYRMTFRQLATLVRLDEKELRINVLT